MDRRRPAPLLERDAAQGPTPIGAVVPQAARASGNR